MGQQVTLDANAAAVAGPRIDRRIARERSPFASQDGSFAPDDGGRVLSDTALRRLATVPGQAMTYICLPPGWPH